MKRLFKLIASNKDKKSLRDPFDFEPRILVIEIKKCNAFEGIPLHKI